MPIFFSCTFAAKRKKVQPFRCHFLNIKDMTTKEKLVANPQAAVIADRYLTAKEAAAYVGASINYFYKLTASHKLPMYNPTGRKLLFKKSELDSWVMSARIPSDSELKTQAQTELMKKGGLR